MTIDIIFLICGILAVIGIGTIIWCMSTAQPEPARVIEYYPSVNAVDNHEIEDIMVLDNDKIIISYLPDFQY